MKHFQNLVAKTKVHFFTFLLGLISFISSQALIAQSEGNELCTVGAQASITCDKVTVNFSGNPTWPTHHWDFGDGTGISGGPTLTMVSHDYLDINPYSFPPPTAGHSLNGVDWCYKELQEFLPGIFVGSGCGSTRAVSNLIANNKLPANELVGKALYIFGNLEVDASYIFDGCTIFVSEGGKITVKPGATLTLKGNTVVDAQTSSGACQILWNGIEVRPGGTLTTNGATIRNAYFAISTINPDNSALMPKLNLQNTVFQRNFVGIYATKGRFAISLFRNNTFEGSGNGAIYSLGNCGSYEPINNAPFANRTYCGIYFDGSLGGSLLLSGASFNNVFKDLQAGIVCINGISSIRGCRFDNIAFLTGSPASYQGTAVTFVDNKGAKRFNFVGLGKANALATVNNCERGIYVVTSRPATEAYITACRMLEVQNGVEMDETLAGEFTKVQISYCDIACTKYLPNIKKRTTGIEIKDPGHTYSNITVNNNDIVLDQPEAYIGNALDEEIFPKGIALYSVHPLTKMDVTIYQNNIHLINGHYGISCENIVNGVITDNHVINDKTALFENSFVGFFVRGGVFNVLTCNTVTQNSNQPVASIVGFVVIGSFVATLSQNTTTDLLTGVAFVDNNGTSCVLSYNNFEIPTPVGLTRYGLYYLNAITGPQFLQGNDWIGDFENGAVYDQAVGAFSYCDSRYDVSQGANVANAINPVDQGAMQNCLTGSDNWFTISGSLENDYSCGSSPGGTGGIAKNVADQNLAGGGTLSLSPGYNWSSEMGLYRKFTENPGLATGDAIINAFLQAQQGLPVATMYTVQNGARNNAGSISSTLLNNIQNTTAQLEANTANMLILLENIDTDPNAMTSFTSLSTQAESLGQLLEGYLAAALSAMAQSAATVKNLNDSISCSSLPCSAERYITGLYLETQLISPRILTVSELESIRQIGLDCPSNAGSVVYLARAWYYIQTGVSLDTSCGSFTPLVLGQRHDQSRLALADDLVLAPNPANDNVEVRLPVILGSCTLLITDMWGRQVLQSELPESSGTSVETISTKGFANGIYLVSVKTKDGKPLTKKLLVSH